MERRDFHGGNGSATWGQVTNGDRLAALLSTGAGPTTSSLRAPVAESSEPDGAVMASAEAGGGLPLRGVGLLALPVVGLALVIGWRRVSDR